MRRTLAVAGIVALALVGCGGDDDDPTDAVLDGLRCGSPHITHQRTPAEQRCWDDWYERWHND